MGDMTFTNIINKGLEMYREGRFEEAYRFMTEHADHEPRNDAQMYDFRASLACRSGRPDLGLELLREAILDKGIWYGQEYLTADEDIRPARGMAGFSPLPGICAERERQARSTAVSDLAMVRNTSGARGPLFVVLHGNMQNDRIAREDWRGTGADLAFVQSSQVAFSDAYVWNDLERGVRDVLSQWEGLRASGHLDRGVVLAGFSAGARLALHLVLNDLVRVEALVLVGPWLPEIAEWSSLVRSAGDRLPGTHIVIGDRDEECLPMARELHEALGSVGATSDLRAIEGMGHDYPPGFGAGIVDAIGPVRGSGR